MLTKRRLAIAGIAVAVVVIAIALRVSRDGSVTPNASPEASSERASGPVAHAPKPPRCCPPARPSPIPTRHRRRWADDRSPPIDGERHRQRRLSADRIDPAQGHDRHRRRRQPDDDTTSLSPC
jgi:hypothetical protein